MQPYLTAEQLGVKTLPSEAIKVETTAGSIGVWVILGENHRTHLWEQMLLTGTTFPSDTRVVVYDEKTCQILWDSFTDLANPSYHSQTLGLAKSAASVCAFQRVCTQGELFSSCNLSEYQAENPKSEEPAYAHVSHTYLYDPAFYAAERLIAQRTGKEENDLEVDDFVSAVDPSGTVYPSDWSLETYRGNQQILVVEGTIQEVSPGVFSVSGYLIFHGSGQVVAASPGAKVAVLECGSFSKAYEAAEALLALDQCVALRSTIEDAVDLCNEVLVDCDVLSTVTALWSGVWEPCGDTLKWISSANQEIASQGYVSPKTFDMLALCANRDNTTLSHLRRMVEECVSSGILEESLLYTESVGEVPFVYLVDVMLLALQRFLAFLSVVGRKRSSVFRTTSQALWLGFERFMVESLDADEFSDQLRSAVWWSLDLGSPTEGHHIIWYFRRLAAHIASEIGGYSSRIALDWLSTCVNASSQGNHLVDVPLERCKDLSDRLHSLFGESLKICRGANLYGWDQVLSSPVESRPDLYGPA